MRQLPERGIAKEEVMTNLRAMQGHDADYHHARTWAYIYNAGPDVDDVIKEAGNHVMLENALSPFAFPSLKEMQRDVVAVVGDLLHGDETTGGAMTSGGTESIFMAVKTARDRMREERGISKGRIVIPRTAHPAFVKAAHYLDLEWVQMPLHEDYKTHAADLQAMLTDDTVLAVGSAPAFPYGMIDPIPAMAAIASNAGVPFHVDACLGGLLLPFIERLGYSATPWDFRVEGVSSISADVHKYGYSVKGSSVLLHRPRANMRYQVFDFDGWPGGRYGTQAFLGTKPAAPIGASWAVLQYLGWDGYLRLARETMDATKRLLDGIRAIDGLDIVGEPEMSVFAVASSTHDIYAVGDVLAERGWHFDRMSEPLALHFMTSPRHALVVDEFLADLRFAVNNNRGASSGRSGYGDDVSAEVQAKGS
jgi:glutamate/tyrosine decarboxylase-like PLP-dependent enzyme